MNKFSEWARSRNAKLVSLIAAGALVAGCAPTRSTINGNLESKVSGKDITVVSDSTNIGSSIADFDSLVLEGVRSYGMKDYRNAAERLEDALDVYDPKESANYVFKIEDIRGTLAESWYKLGDYTRALDFALPNDYLFKGDCYAQMWGLNHNLEDLDSAILLYEMGLSIEPNNPDASYRAGLSYYDLWLETGEESARQTAITRLNSAIKLYGNCENCGDVRPALDEMARILKELNKTSNNQEDK